LFVHRSLDDDLGRTPRRGHAFEAEACKSISWVEELGEGLRLHLKATAPTVRLATQLQCHLAFAQARGFDRAPCPLFVRGVKITVEASAIDFRSLDAKVASEVRAEGRKMFGAPIAEQGK